MTFRKKAKLHAPTWDGLDWTVFLINLIYIYSSQEYSTQFTVMSAKLLIVRIRLKPLCFTSGIPWVVRKFYFFIVYKHWNSPIHIMCYFYNVFAFNKLRSYNTMWQKNLQENEQNIKTNRTTPLCYYLFQCPKYKLNCLHIQQLARSPEGQILSSSQETDAFWHVRDIVPSEGVELLLSGHCTHSTLCSHLLTAKQKTPVSTL